MTCFQLQLPAAVPAAATAASMRADSLLHYDRRKHGADVRPLTSQALYEYAEQPHSQSPATAAAVSHPALFLFISSLLLLLSQRLLRNLLLELIASAGIELMHLFLACRGLLAATVSVTSHSGDPRTDTLHQATLKQTVRMCARGKG